MRYDSGSQAVQRYMRSRAARREAAEAEEEHAAPLLSVAPIRPEQRVPAEQAHEAIDLLNPEAATVVDLERLRWALSFGFAGGDIGGVLLDAMRRAPVAASDWNAECFASGLFVQDLIRTCMRVRLGPSDLSLDTTFIARVLTHPPRERAVVEHRRGIAAELAQNALLRASFEELYLALHHVRALLDSQGAVRELDGRRRKLEVLSGIREILELMTKKLASSKSALARIQRFAIHATQSDAYRHLVDLLDYDNHLASVDLQLRIGSDGRIRHFAITKVSENRGNRFYRSPFGRWLTRMGLLLRGFSMGEPEVLNSWIDAAFEGVQHLLPPMFQLLGEMEVYLAALAFRDAASARGLPTCLPVLHERAELDAQAPPDLGYEQLFNPLLFAHPAPITACALPASAFRATTLVTGPNSGGKTRLLQAVAIAQMLGQSGFYVPARTATLERASGLFVSLIEEARADQKEGRLGTELCRIRELFERARPGSLIVLDELCSGTNPSEGEDIIRLVLSLLGELRASVFITTHFLQFATRLSQEPLPNAQLSFLQVELDANEDPTYRFVPGVAHTSLAHRTAARLGVTREELLALIEHNKPRA